MPRYASRTASKSCPVALAQSPSARNMCCEFSSHVCAWRLDGPEHQGRVWSAVYGLAWLVGCSFEQFGCLGAACGLAGGVQIAPPSLAPEERKQNSFLAGLARGGRKGGSW
jgi:hypothetical protein